MRHRLAGAVLALCATLTTAAQSPPGSPRPGLILGRVIDAVSGRPVSGAIVQLVPAHGQTPILTGQDGQFLFSPLPTGFHQLIASKPGYLDTAYGQMRARGEGTMLLLTSEHPRRLDVTLRMWPWGSIAGQVTDEHGQPVVGVQVETWFRGANGRLDVEPARFAITDSQGRYAIPQLRPGHYIVGFVCGSYNVGAKLEAPLTPANPLAGRLENRVLLDRGVTGFVSHSCSTATTTAQERARLYRTTFYGEARDPRAASLVAVQAGEMVHGIDLRLGSEWGYRLAGRLDARANPGGVYLRLVPSGWSGDSRMFLHQAFTTSDGSFVFVAVLAGSYTISAAVGQRVWIDQTIAVDRDLDDLIVTAHPGIRIAGHVQPADALSGPATFELTLEGRKYPVQADAKGLFAIADLPRGRRLFAPRPTAGAWQIVSATLGGREVFGDTIDIGPKDMSGLVLHLSERATTLAGNVVDAQGAADAATVVFFPANAGLWPGARDDSPLFRAARTWSGHYTLERVPAGDFLIAAVDDAVLEDWPDAALLSRIAAVAERIQMAAGQQIQRDLRVQSGIR